MSKETKTVAVYCIICGWEGRRHRTEMAPGRERAKCPKCRRWRSVVYESPKESRIVDAFKGGKSRAKVAKAVGVPISEVDKTLRGKIKPGG